MGDGADNLKGWANWAGDQTCEPARIIRPRTREGLASAIGSAVADELTVKVSASGHSFSDIALTDGVMIRIDALNRILEADPASGRVKVEAGVTLHSLNRKLAGLGRAFENLGDIDAQTLAGSISTGTHGTGVGFQNVSAQVEAIEMVLADGSFVEFSAAADADAFKAARVGLGALGAIYAVTLKTVPAYRLRRVDRPVPLEEALDGLDQLADSNDHFEFYVFPHTETALLRESERTDAPAQPASKLSRWAREVVLENWAVGALGAVGRANPSAIPALSRAVSRRLGNEVKLDHSYEVFASERRVQFTEMEYGIPRAKAAEAIRRVLDLAARPELEVGMPIEVRFVAPDDALLSPSHDRETAYIAVHMFKGTHWEPYFAGVEAIMDDYDGRPHWGKRHGQSADTLADRYPRWGTFQKVRERLDPNCSFRNAYTDRVLGSAPPSSTDNQSVSSATASGTT